MVVAEGYGSRAAAALSALQAIADSAAALCSAPGSEATCSDGLEVQKKKLDEVIKKHGDLVSTHVPEIRHTLQAPLEDRSMHIERIDQLSQLVQVLQQEVNKLTAAERACQQRFLLGQAACRLDEVAHAFVFRGVPQIALLSVGEIRKRAERDELTQEQAENWEVFKHFLAVRGWRVSDIVAVAKPLRAECYADAHGSEEEQQQVTQAQLEEWASCHLKPAEVEGVKSLIRLVAEFACDGKVLRSVDNAVQVVQASLGSQA